jgi:hypothetical protein
LLKSSQVYTETTDNPTEAYSIAVTDAVGLAPSLLPRPGAVAITSPPPRLRVSGVVVRVV